MNNQIIRYKQDRWNKIINKIKVLFWHDRFEINKDVNTLPNNDIDEFKGKYEPKKKFVELLTQLELGNITEKELKIDEIKMLTKYYEHENADLDKIIENQNKKIDELNLQLNGAYEQAIKLKMK